MTSTVAILDVSPVFDTSRTAVLSLLQGAGPRQPLAARRFGDTQLLTWMVRRISHAQQISRVVVVGDASIRQHASLVEAAGVPMIASSAVDPLARLASAVQQLSRQPHAATDTAYIRVSIDSPFVDPALLDGLAIQGAANPQADYITYRTSQESVTLAHLGLAGEYFRGAALAKADREAPVEMRRQPLQFIRSRPDLFQLRLLAAHQALCKGDLRLAVQTPEDWDNVQAIREALDAGENGDGPFDRENVGWRQITALLDKNSGMRKRMAEINAAAHPQI